MPKRLMSFKLKSCRLVNNKNGIEDEAQSVKRMAKNTERSS